MGGALFLIGFGTFVLIGVRRTRQLAEASTSWPAAWGTVVASHVEPERGEIPARHHFEAVTPAAGGRHCFVVRFGHQPSPESLVAAYPVGASVLIHFDPDEGNHRVKPHDHAVIEPGVFPLSRLQQVVIHLVTWGSIAGGVVMAVSEVL